MRNLVQLVLCHILFVGDEAFPLKKNLMRPYPGRILVEKRKIFSYLLSRARRVIENAFGILISLWRIFRQPIITKPAFAVRYTLAAIALHNFLRAMEPTIYCPPRLTDAEKADGSTVEEEWRAMESVLTPITLPKQSKHSRNAGSIRDVFGRLLYQHCWRSRLAI